MTSPHALPASRSLTAALAVALLLVLGVAGSAYAADLTAKQVRKIAAKVVKNKAPKLNVAYAQTAGSAATATTATTLGGSTSAQLKTTGYKFLLPTQATAAAREYSFPGLPVGTYLVTYSYAANIAGAGAVVECALQGVVGNIAAPSNSSPGTFAPLIVKGSSSTIVTTTASTELRCTSSTSTFHINPANQNTVNFVPIDTLAIQGPATSS